MRVVILISLVFVRYYGHEKSLFNAVLLHKTREYVLNLRYFRKKKRLKLIFNIANAIKLSINPDRFDLGTSEVCYGCYA